PDQFDEVYGDPATTSATVGCVHRGYVRPRTDHSHARPLAVSLAEHGVHVALAEYRRAGGQPHSLDDVTAAIASIRAELPGWGLGRRAQENLIVSGHSAGGCLVLGWASHLPEEGPRIRLRPLAPVTDLLREVAGGLADGAVLDYMRKTPEDDLTAYLRHDPRPRAALIPARVEVLSIHGMPMASSISGSLASSPLPAPICRGPTMPMSSTPIPRILRGSDTSSSAEVRARACCVACATVPRGSRSACAPEPAALRCRCPEAWGRGQRRGTRFRAPRGACTAG